MDLCKDLNNIEWTRVQCDDANECEAVMAILADVERYPPAQALRILLEVIEYKSLQVENAEHWKDKANPFRDMKGFRYIGTSLNNFPTRDYIRAEDRHPGYNV